MSLDIPPRSLTMIYTLEFHAPWPLLGIEPGHFLALNTAEPYPLHMLACRPLPIRHDLVLGALEENAAELVNPHLSAADLAVAVGHPARLPLPAGRHLLRLVR